MCTEKKTWQNALEVESSLENPVAKKSHPAWLTWLEIGVHDLKIANPGQGSCQRDGEYRGTRADEGCKITCAFERLDRSTSSIQLAVLMLGERRSRVGSSYVNYCCDVYTSESDKRTNRAQMSHLGRKQRCPKCEEQME